MPVSGLVLTLSRDSKVRANTFGQMHAHPSIDVGELQGHRLPIVADTRSSEEDKALWTWLHSLDGVLFVDLVYADMSEDTNEGAAESGPSSMPQTRESEPMNSPLRATPRSGKLPRTGTQS